MGRLTDRNGPCLSAPGHDQTEIYQPLHVSLPTINIVVAELEYVVRLAV